MTYPPTTTHVRPEWLRIPQAQQVFGIGRSKLYELIAAGDIRSAAVKERGKLKGVRLLSYDSLASYIERYVVAPKDEKEAAE